MIINLKIVTEKKASQHNTDTKFRCDKWIKSYKQRNNKHTHKHIKKDTQKYELVTSEIERVMYDEP